MALLRDLNRINYMEIDPIANLAIKIVAVGDHLVGKSCAITSFITSKTPLDRHSTVFDSSACQIRVDGSSYNLSVWDTTGNQAYKQLIKSCFNDAEIFLIFFSVIDPTSFQNAIKKWYPQVRQVNSKALVLFVGNKTDLRDQQAAGKAVSTSQATSKIEQQLKTKYLECSAMTQKGLEHVFEYSVMQHLIANNRLAPKKHARDSNTCCLVM